MIIWCAILFFRQKSKSFSSTRVNEKIRCYDYNYSPKQHSKHGLDVARVFIKYSDLFRVLLDLCKFVWCTQCTLVIDHLLHLLLNFGTDCQQILITAANYLNCFKTLLKTHLFRQAKKKNCQMYVYSGHALSYTKLVHRHATQTEGNKYFKWT